MKKYNIIEISPAGEQLLDGSDRLKDAKELLASYRDRYGGRIYLIPCHGPNYYIEYSGNVFLTVRTK